MKDSYVYIVVGNFWEINLLFSFVCLFLLLSCFLCFQPFLRRVSHLCFWQFLACHLVNATVIVPLPWNSMQCRVKECCLSDSVLNWIPKDREFTKPKRRSRQEDLKFAYLTTRFARALFSCTFCSRSRPNWKKRQCHKSLIWFVECGKQSCGTLWCNFFYQGCLQ